VEAFFLFFGFFSFWCFFLFVWGGVFWIWGGLVFFFFCFCGLWFFLQRKLILTSLPKLPPLLHNALSLSIQIILNADVHLPVLNAAHVL